MNLKPNIDDRLSELTSIMKQAKPYLVNPPEGSLVVESRNSKYYYSIRKKDPVTNSLKKEYICQNDMKRPCRIALRDYGEKVLQLSQKEYQLLTKVQEFYKKNNSCEELYLHLPAGKKRLISPIAVTNEEYANLWLMQRSGQSNQLENDTPYYSENGEHVRSKSEKIIADQLKLMGVAYKYEEALTLDNRTIFPDFTLLNPHTREEIYWEHFGFVDDDEYRKKMIQRINFYNQHHIIFGKNLIASFESGTNHLSTLYVKNMINEILVASPK